MRLAPPLASGFLLGVALLVPRVAHAQAPAQAGTWALTNARIETVTKGTIEKGTIVIRDGIIEAVGANVTPPGDARVVDLTGRTVYPGFIDLTSSMGLPTPPQPQGGRVAVVVAVAADRTPARRRATSGSSRAASSRTKSRPPSPTFARRATRASRPHSSRRRAARSADCRRSSRCAMTRRRSYVVKAPVGNAHGIPGRRWPVPGTLLGVIAYERQQLYDAQRHGLLDGSLQGRPARRPASDIRCRSRRARTGRARPAAGVLRREQRERDPPRGRHREGVRSQADDRRRDGSVPRARRGEDARGHSWCRVDFPQAVEVTGWAYRGAQRRELNDSATRDAAVRKIVEANAATLNTRRREVRARAGRAQA